MNLYYIDCNLEWELKRESEEEKKDEHFMQAIREFNGELAICGSIYSFHLAAEYPDQLLPIAKNIIRKSYPAVIEEDSQIWIERVQTAVGLGGRKFSVRLEEFNGHLPMNSNENSRLLFLAKNNVPYHDSDKRVAIEMRDFHIASQYPDLAAYVAFANLKMEFPTLVRKELCTTLRELSIVNGVDDKRYVVFLDEIKQ